MSPEEGVIEAWIGVDVHVWRVTNRWGIVAARTPEQAIPQLEGVLPREYWVEINRLLVLAEAGLLAGNPAQARASAREAVRLAQITGKGWEMERGSGLSLLAQAELALGQRDIALVMFEQSVRQFELAGSSLKADQAQSRAGRLRQPNAADPPLAGTGPRGQAE